MRTFDDADGQRWQAALLEASYGDILVVFNPLAGDDIRQKLLGADNLVDGETEFAALDDDGLRALLAEAAPWDHQAGVTRARAAYGGHDDKAPIRITRRKSDA